MNAEKFKKIILEQQESAVQIACALYGYPRDEFSYVDFCEDEVEVHFEGKEYAYCEDTSYSVILKIDDLFQDIGDLVERKKQERLLIKIKQQEEIILQKKKDKDNKEKYEYNEYIRLKEKFK